MSGVICDRSIAVKGKVYQTVVRPAVIYGAGGVKTFISSGQDGHD